MKRLRYHVAESSFDQVTIVAKGLSDIPGENEFYTAKEMGSDGLTNLGTVSMFKLGKARVVSDVIETTTVDSYIANNNILRVDGMKIDVEGAELSMLRGASRTIEKYRPWIICEVNKKACSMAGYDAAEILRYLVRFGYRIHKIGRFGSLSPVTERQLSNMQNIFAYRKDWEANSIASGVHLQTDGTDVWSGKASVQNAQDDRTHRRLS